MGIFSLSVRNVQRQRKRNVMVIIAIAFCAGFSIATSAMAKGMSTSAIEYISLGSGGQFGISTDERIKTDDNSFVRVSVIKDPDDLVNRIKSSNIPITAYNYRIEGSASMSSPSKTDDHFGSQIVGFKQQEIKDISQSYVPIKGSFEELFSEPNSVLITEIFAERMGVKPGDDVLISAQTYKGQANTLNAKVVGYYQSKGSVASYNVYMSIETANALFQIPKGQVNTIKLQIVNNDEIAKIKSELEEYLTKPNSKYPLALVKNTEVENSIFNNTIMRDTFVADDSQKQSWEGERLNLASIIDWAGILFQASGFVGGMGFVILLIILVVTIVGLTNNFRMIIIERTREIGTLRAMGMQVRDLSKSFFYETLILLIFGLFFGYLFGGFLIFIFSVIPFNVPEFTEIMFRNNHVHFSFDWTFFTIYTLTISIFVLLASLLPVFWASKIQPAEALREAH